VSEEYRVVEHNAGGRYWYKPGTLISHRIGGPAVEWSNGYKAWFKDGLQHREDGPAVMHTDGTNLYYLNGKLYSEEEFMRKTNPEKNAPVKELTVKELEKHFGCRVKVVK